MQRPQTKLISNTRCRCRSRNSPLGACRRIRSGFDRPFFRLAASGCIDDTTNIACFAVFARRKNCSVSGRRRDSTTGSLHCEVNDYDKGGREVGCQGNRIFRSLNRERPFFGPIHGISAVAWQNFHGQAERTSESRALKQNSYVAGKATCAMPGVRALPYGSCPDSVGPSTQGLRSAGQTRHSYQTPARRPHHDW